MKKPVSEQRLDPCLLPFLQAKDEQEAREQLAQLIVQVTPLIEKITTRSRHPKDNFQESVRQVIIALWACKADPVSRAIEKFEPYVAVLAKHVVIQGDTIAEPSGGPVSGDSQDEGGRASHTNLPSTEVPPDEEMEWEKRLTDLWAEIERLSPEQCLAYLLNFTDGEGELDIFWKYGVVSLHRLATTLQLSDEQSTRLWSVLELKEDERQQVAALTRSEEKAAACHQGFADRQGGNTKFVDQSSSVTRNCDGNRSRAELYIN